MELCVQVKYNNNAKGCCLPQMLWHDSGTHVLHNLPNQHLQSTHNADARMGSTARMVIGRAHGE